MITTEKAMEIMQAYLDGKVIERGTAHGWVEISKVNEPEWNFRNEVYQVKPGVFHVYVHIMPSGVHTFNTYKARLHEVKAIRLQYTVRGGQVLDEKKVQSGCHDCKWQNKTTVTPKCSACVYGAKISTNLWEPKS